MTFFYRNFSYAILFSWLGTFLSSILKLLRAPIIIYTIGLDQYGIWITIILLMGIAINFENVITSIISKKISNSSETNISERIFFIKNNNSVFNKLIFKISLGFSLLYFASIQIIHSLSSGTIEYKYLLLHDVAASISIILYLFGLKFVAYIDGIDSVHYGRLGKIFYEVFGFLLILSILYFKTFHMLGFVLLLQSIGFYIFSAYIYSFITKKQKPYLESVENKNIDYICYKSFLKDSLRLISLQSGTILYSMTPILLIPVLYSYTASAQYALLIQLCQFSNLLIMPILVSFLPKLVHDVKSKNIINFIWLMNIAFLALVIYFFFLQVFIEDIFPLWIGKEYALGKVFLAIVSVICVLDIYNQFLRQICLSLDFESSFFKIFIKSTFIFLFFLAVILIINENASKYFLILMPTLFSIIYLVGALFQIISKSSSLNLLYFTPQLIIFYLIIYIIFSIIVSINWIFAFYTLMFSIIIYLLYVYPIFMRLIKTK